MGLLGGKPLLNSQLVDVQPLACPGQHTGVFSYNGGYLSGFFFVLRDINY